MENNEEAIKLNILNFKLPRYNEIPNIGLFLDQVVKYIDGALSSLNIFKVTPAMISNYVKMKIVDNPIGKTYKRDQIAYLMYITITKYVLSLEDIETLFKILDNQPQPYTLEIAYNYFCDEFENSLKYVFGIKDSMDIIGDGMTDEKKIFKNTILSLAYKIYIIKHISNFKK